MRLYKYITTIALILIASASFGQTQLLEKYNFDEGGYYLIGTHSESDYNALAKDLGEFYTDDIEVLNAIKKEWTFKRPSPQYACGYHYEVTICKNGLELETLLINLNCNVIVSDDGYFYFEAKQLEMFKDCLKKPFRKQEKFVSLAEARNYRNTILKDTTLILTPTPDWTKYEGTFKFTYVCPAEDEGCYENEKEILEKLTEEIAMNYPGEPFELSGRGGSNTQLFVEVKSNKSLADKFNLYKRNLEYDKWESYNLFFYTFWTIKKQ